MEIPQQFAAYFAQHHFHHLTPIQAQTYNPLMQGQSVLGLAPTGSGKTLAFGMPLITQVQPQQGLQKLILEPTQELAIQTRNVLRSLAPELNIYGVIGGANRQRQIEKLKTKPEIVVGTLGRVHDLVTQRKLKLAKLQTIVVDEADLMVSDKLPELRQLLQRAPAGVQLVFFSATSTPQFQKLSQLFHQQFVIVDQSQDSFSRQGLQHYFVLTDENHKIQLLKQLAHRKSARILVFCASGKSLHRLAATLRYQKLYFMVLDTSDPKRRREEAIRTFEQKQASILLTTDVAARGMDLPAITTVVNWQNPANLTQYIHRSGRTGRMGHDGEVVTLGNQHDWRQLQHLLQASTITARKVQLQNGKFSGPRTTRHP